MTDYDPKEAVRQIIASNRLEGMQPPPGAEEVLLLVAERKITVEQGNEIALKMAKREITPDEGIALARKMASK